jgi:large subunit ribosomal protein L16
MIRPETRGIKVSFGSWGLKAQTQKRVTSNQIEAARRVISRTMGKTGKMWIRIFPDRPFTSKAAEVPMGKGKGDPEGFVCEVRPGRIIFEIDGVPEDVAREAMRKASMKLPIKTKVVTRDAA